MRPAPCRAALAEPPLFGIAVEDAKLANWHMHELLYRLIEPLMEQVLACPLDTLDQVRINVRDAPDPEKVGRCL